MQPPPPSTESLLRDLAALPGVVAIALADTRLGQITQPSLSQPISTEQRVLSEAMLSAAQQIAERAGLGQTRELHQLCQQGGLFFVRVDPQRWLILHHAGDALPALLRLALRETSEKLALTAVPAPSSPPPSWNTTPAPRLGDLPKVLFREQKGLVQVESTVYNSPESA